MDRVVVARKYVLAGEAVAHDRGQVVGMGQAHRVSNFVHGGLEPLTAVFALAPVLERVHHDRGDRSAVETGSDPRGATDADDAARGRSRGR